MVLIRTLPGILLRMRCYLSLNKHTKFSLCVIQGITPPHHIKKSSKSDGLNHGFIPPYLLNYKFFRFRVIQFVVCLLLFKLHLACDQLKSKLTNTMNQLLMTSDHYPCCNLQTEVIYSFGFFLFLTQSIGFQNYPIG